MTFHDLVRHADDFDRRAFVHGAARGLLGVWAAPLLIGRATAATRQDPAHQDPAPTLRPATARRVIYLYMSGGMSHLDTFDPKPGAPEMGPTGTIPTIVDGIQVSEHFTNLARCMDRVAVINSMWSSQGAHVQGRYYVHTSYLLRGTVRHPSMGAWLSRIRGPLNPTLPPHVEVGGDIYSASGGFMESRYYPLPIGDPDDGLAHAHLPKTVSDEEFHRRLDRVERMNAAFAERYGQEKLVQSYADAYHQAVTLMQSSDLQAFDLSDEPDALRDDYGRDQFGQGCLLARRLIEHDVRYVEVVSGGWDTHNENFDAMEEKCPSLDRTLTTLLLDLEARGLLDDTLVVLASEFGRTPRIDPNRNGRDHHPQGFTCLLAGGGIKGGVRHGMTDERGDEVVDGKVTVPDFNATIAYALGLPLDYRLISPSGRPFTVADKGKPVRELFA